MLFAWWKKRRRRSLRELPAPVEWRATLQRNVPMFSRLVAAEQTKLLRDMQVFIAEKNWEGCAGLELTDEMKVTIAAQACLLVLGFEDEYFDRVLSVLVYPSDFAMPTETAMHGGGVVKGESQFAGEAWYRGPVILSWEDVLAGGRDESDGENVVLHEFAHQLDMLNGRFTDGTPPLATADQVTRWNEVVHREHRKLKDDCRRRRPTLLDCYGAENLSEFFAVATECFFERPRAMSVRHPELYGILREFYRQEPKVRF